METCRFPTGKKYLGAAERAYRQALEVDDLFYPAKMNLAVLLAGQQRTAESERLLREVLVAYPDNADAAYSLGLLALVLWLGVRWIYTNIITG